MATAFYSAAASFKPQILTRQEGFHLPSPAPSTPPSSDGTPSSNGNPANGSPTSPTANGFDTHNLFISPPSYLSVPETFRKFPSADSVHGSMDFSDELASLITNPHPSSHERSTQNSNNGYDDYRPQTHNIFDISAPTSHHSHGPQSPHSPYPSGQSAFSLPPASSLAHHSLHSPSSSLHHTTHPLHEFTSHFNSTVPAIGSSMRYEPSPHTPHNQTSSPHPFALNTSSSMNGNAGNVPGAEPSSVSSFTSHMSSLSTFSGLSNTTAATSTNDFNLNGPSTTRQTPSPVLPPPTPISTTSGRDHFSRSRSRSRSSVSTTQQPPLNPPSTNGGPARRTRAKRGSVSSVSPPPLHRGHITQPLVIPGASPGAPNGARSPLSLHTSGWFGMGTPGSLGNGGMGEYSLPTPESVHGGFASFGGAGIMQGSPKDIGMGLASQMGAASMAGGNGKGESPPNELAAKQAIIANEKRRRRRESHNAVERRRRDNINEKISELATLIPECLLDPNATLTMPATLSSATNDDLLFGGAAAPSSSSPLSPSPAKLESKEDMEDKEAADQAGGVIKANKGLILKKSVEYIRYLQQLVSAQASRNRDLEQQLHSLRGSSSGGSSNIHGGGDTSSEDDLLMLHEEVSDFNLSLNMHHADGRKRFNGFELESVAEMEQDTEHPHLARGAEVAGDEDQDQDMERPSTADTGASPLSAGSASDEEGEEEERGRKGRDGRPMGMNGAVKVEDDMQTS